MLSLQSHSKQMTQQQQMVYAQQYMKVTLIAQPVAETFEAFTLKLT